MRQKEKIMKTEKQAWLYLAKLWDNPFRANNGSFAVKITGSLYDEVCYGLCFCCRGLVETLVISKVTQRIMLGKIHAVVASRIHRNPEGYCWSRISRCGARARARFCRRMAKECGSRQTKGKK